MSEETKPETYGCDLCGHLTTTVEIKIGGQPYFYEIRIEDDGEVYCHKWVPGCYLIEAVADRDAARAQVERLQSDLATKEYQLDNLRADAKRQAERASSYANALSQVEAEAENWRKQFQELGESYDRVFSDASQFESDLNKARNEVEQLRQERDAARAEVERLQQFEPKPVDQEKLKSKIAKVKAENEARMKSIEKDLGLPFRYKQD